MPVWWLEGNGRRLEGNQWLLEAHLDAKGSS